MITFIKTDYQNIEFQYLVQALNSDLAQRDGADHPLAQFNAIHNLKYVMLAMVNGQAVGCGAIAPYEEQTMEIKRMYVKPECRGKRIGEKILRGLEDWSRSLGNNKCILFMGSKQPEALKLYDRNGYKLIQNYGKLKAIPDSICLAKEL